MIDYAKMTTEELVSELDKLHQALEMDLMMDGSGELGGVIYQVLNERPDIDNFFNENN